MNKIVLIAGPLPDFGAAVADYYAALEKEIQDGMVKMIEFQGEVLSVDWSVESDERWGGTKSHYEEAMWHKINNDQDLKRIYRGKEKEYQPVPQSFRGYMNSRQRYKK